MTALNLYCSSRHVLFYPSSLFIHYCCCFIKCGWQWGLANRGIAVLLFYYIDYKIYNIYILPSACCHVRPSRYSRLLLNWQSYPLFYQNQHGYAGTLNAGNPSTPLPVLPVDEHVQVFLCCVTFTVMNTLETGFVNNRKQHGGQWKYLKKRITFVCLLLIHFFLSNAVQRTKPLLHFVCFFLYINAQNFSTQRSLALKGPSVLFLSMLIGAGAGKYP